LWSTAKKLTDFLVFPPGPWVPFGGIAQGGWGSTSSTFPLLAAAYKIDAFKNIVWRGSIEVASYSDPTDGKFATIPWNTLGLPIPPIENIYFSVVAQVAGSMTNMTVRFQTDGDCILLGGVAGQHIILYLDSIVIQLPDDTV
jgi:hypothetical protein